MVLQTDPHIPKGIPAQKTLKETIQLTYKMKRTATIDSQFFNSKHVILIKILLKPCTNPFT